MSYTLKFFIGCSIYVCSCSTPSFSSPANSSHPFRAVLPLCTYSSTSTYTYNHYNERADVTLTSNLSSRLVMAGRPSVAVLCRQLICRQFQRERRLHHRRLTGRGRLAAVHQHRRQQQQQTAAAAAPAAATMSERGGNKMAKVGACNMWGSSENRSSRWGLLGVPSTHQLDSDVQADELDQYYRHFD